MPGKCTFTNAWITNTNYSAWISKDKDPHKAKCVVCPKTFDISNMGEAAVKSHMAGQKHKKNMAAITDTDTQANPVRLNTLSSYFSHPNQGASTSERPSTSAATPSSTSSDISSYLTPDSVLKAEILWTFKLIDSHYSYNSSNHMSDLFQAMFPDSEIASRFACGEHKARYLATFGLGPYFKLLMKQKIKDADAYVLLFDESLNKSMKMKQLDIHARIFDNDIVTTRYVGSEFMGHATADDLHDRLWPIIQDFGTSNLLQLSMDGPNVNWKLFDLLCADMRKECPGKTLLNIGSCGMHVMHNAFRSGCEGSEWNIEEILCSMHRLFKDSPARSDDFEQLTKSSTFPKQFCRHRWLENITVMTRALEVLPNLQQYVEAVEKAKIPNPKTKTYETVRTAVKDPLFVAKGEFFISVANEVEPFLTSYQTQSPMVPFLSTDLKNTVKNLMQRFVKEEVMLNANTASKLSKVELKDKNLKDASKVDLGFVTKNALSQATRKNKLSERAVLQFKLQCKHFLLNTTKKLLEKSPMKYSLVRSAVWLDPQQISKYPTPCKTALSTCLQVLVNAGQANMRECDRITKEYEELISKGDVVQFETFNRETRLDTFYAPVSKLKEYQHLWKVMKLILSLSHGQADVERGFSVNNQVEVENQMEQALISRRLIIDHIRQIGGVTNISVGKDMLSHAKNARQRYRTYLEEEQQKKKQEAKGEKRKSLENDIESLKKRKLQLEKDVASLVKDADETAESAEESGNLSLISKSNAMRRHAKEKSKMVEDVEKQIQDKSEELKKKSD